MSPSSSRRNGRWLGRALTQRRRHPFAAVAILLVVLFACGSAYATLSPSTTSSPTASAAAQTTQIEEGRQLFAIGCASCHGLGGEGQVRDDGTVLGPSLIGVGAASVDFQVGTGRMPMAAPGAQAERKTPSYSEEQTAALAAYVESLAPGPEIPDDAMLDTNAEGVDVARGGLLFRTNCAQCHNTTGQGGALTYGQEAPNLTGVDPKHIYEAMLTGPQAMPVFNDETLDPVDKRDIIAYLESVENEPDPGGLGIGRAGPVSEGLWAWLVGIGGLIAFAAWIVTRSASARRSS
ncbi:c-type cytochrome [Phytoactinopolyspora endophytica]|uniref:cytochrome bc1 complex diheme cytochrome c subunit n=1 Tax=Phytoactinopolyspora endophytica TaxID=1642495 RepID=UPI001F102D9F|nr:c-type cytochrome [Phytoactinopolyspora endophytica]